MAILAAAAALSLVSCAGSPPPRPVEPPPLPPPPVATRFVAPKVGVALGGGGARGLAEVGVLRVLEQEKIPIDVVVGTSVGSLIGALYADTGRVLDAEFLAVQVEAEDIFDFSALSLFNGGFAKGERIEQFVRTHLKHRTIEEMAVPFAAVATNLRTGRAVAFDRGSVATAVRASAAIPGVFQPVLIGGITYVDGGVVDPVPVGVARKKGADVVIAVAIPPAVPSKAPENPFEVVHHSITIMAAEIGRLRSREADVLIEPEVGDVRYDDFSPKKRLIEAGEAAARKALPAIRAAIAAKTREVPVP